MPQTKNGPQVDRFLCRCKQNQADYLQRPMREPVLVTLSQSFLVTFFSALLATVESVSVSFTDAQPLKPNTATGNSIAIHFFSILFIPD
ncbi:hypothetical protein Shewana3_0298 [Shewanella sp. ANA-3]|nr:hypothetical protein Shewana3_0298 [Shewanella sp. ANA-3]